MGPLALALVLAAARAPAPGDGAAPELAARTEEFRRGLERLRAGDRSELSALLDTADLLCREHERCDAVTVARHYASLSDADLAQGLELERRFGALYRSAFAARSAPPAQLADLFTDLCDELAELAREGDLLRDAVPAARARSFAARLAVERLDLGVPGAGERAALVELAQRDAQQSLEVFRDVGMPTPALEPLWVLGRALLHADRSADARRALAECLREAERLDRPEFAARAAQGLLRLAEESGDAAAARRLLERLARACGADDWRVVRAQAERTLQEDRPEDAARLLRAHAQAPGADPAEWHLLAGGAAVRAGRRDEAREHYEAVALAGGAEAARLALASLDLIEGRPEEALRGLPDGELADARRRAHALVVQGEAELALGRHDEAVEQVEDALALARAVRAGLGDEALTADVVGEWLGLHAVVVLAGAHLAAGRPAEAAAAAEGFQSRELRAARGERVELAASDLLAWSDEQPLGLVTWAVGADGGVVAHLAPAGAPAGAPVPRAWAARTAHGREAVRSAGRRLREALVAGREARARELAREIAREVAPAPLAERLRSLADAARARGEEPRVLLLVHGPLETMPVEYVLEAGAELELLPCVLPGLPSAAPGDAPPPDFARLGPWAVVAGAADRAPELPDARREAEELAPRLGAAPLTGAGARAELVAAVERGAPLHLAAHLVTGCACDDPRLARLALALEGGDLCAHEIARRAAPTPLVFLGACESGAGLYVDAEGLHGIARAFLERGARNLVVTQWPVEDGAAREFAAAFHGALASGEPPSAAVRAGRAELERRGAPLADRTAFRLLGRD